MLYHFMLEIQHDCLFSVFSQNHPKIEIQRWCNTQHDIIELKGDKKDLEPAITDLEEGLGSVITIFPDQGHVQLVLRLCKDDVFRLDNIFHRYNCLELPPIKYFAGREICNLIVTPEDAGLILEDIRKENPSGKVNVIKLAPLKSATEPYPFYLPLDRLKNDLTLKQQEVLKLAYTKGYYELPRSIFLEDLAKEMNIHRRTYEEHLRKAEKKIMSYLVPSLML
ncbi:MAG: helix-turn-helix domain-containing protein [Candidatus Heimdallarchaeota archaeon]|nr:MAG: helix-turn-helix domain-containing protein [Candidatus Heimdallarchaeota archaeon]